MHDELILNTGCRVSFESNLLAFTNRLRLLLVQLFLETNGHLEELAFSGDLGLLPIVLGSQISRRGRLTLAGVFNENFGMGEMPFGGSHAPIGR